MRMCSIIHPHPKQSNIEGASEFPAGLGVHSPVAPAVPANLVADRFVLPKEVVDSQGEDRQANGKCQHEP